MLKCYDKIKYDNIPKIKFISLHIDSAVKQSVVYVDNAMIMFFFYLSRGNQTACVIKALLN